jgi:uncharacterized membrane protein
MDQKTLTSDLIINNIQFYKHPAAKVLLGASLVLAGISHLTFARRDFQAQLPNWVPLKKDDAVIYSGFAEIALGAALALSPKDTEKTMGKVAACFFAAVFPGNIAQYTQNRNAFGLDTSNKRFTRLLFQAVLIAWALKSTH